MRAEERHEMRESELSNWLQYGAWAFLKQNGSYILLIAALCFLGYTLYQRHVQNQENERLTAYQSLTNAIDEETAITNPALWASQLRVDTAMSGADLETSAKADADVGLFQQAAAKYRAAAQKYAEAAKAATNSAGQRAAQRDYDRITDAFLPLLQKETQHILDRLKGFVDTSPIKPVQARAALELGRIYGELAAKRDLTTSTRPESLSKSYEYYSKALELEGDDPLIAAKAHLGIAGVYEDQGDWDKARAEYQSVASGPQFAGPLADLAKERLSTLDERRDAPRLAAWTPPQPVAPTPTPEIGGLTLPSINLNMPSNSLVPPSTGPSQFMVGPMLGTPPGLTGVSVPPTTSAPALPLPLPTPATQPK